MPIEWKPVCEVLELKPVYENTKSFYKKAKVEKLGDSWFRLISFRTNILTYNKLTKELLFLVKDEQYFTQTTCRHINEFFRQFTHFERKKRKEIIDMAQVMYYKEDK